MDSSEWAIPAFLLDRPDMSNEVSLHPTLGWIISQRGVKAFAEWAVGKGHTTEAKARRGVEVLDAVVQKIRNEAN